MTQSEEACCGIWVVNMGGIPAWATAVKVGLGKIDDGIEDVSSEGISGV